MYLFASLFFILNLFQIDLKDTSNFKEILILIKKI